MLKSPSIIKIAKVMVLMLLLLSAMGASVLGAEESLGLDFERNSEFQQGRDFLDRAFYALGEGDTSVAHRYFARAERHFSNAMERDAQDVIIMMHRATAYLGLEKYEWALDDFETILALDPAFVPAYEGKALTYELTGDIESAKEMQAIVDIIYEGLSPQVEDIEQETPPSPNSPHGTWYANNTRHSYTNRVTGQFHPYDSGFACWISSPWKANIENAVYFHLPWSTWNRNTQGLKAIGYMYWANLNGYLQGYTNTPPFLGWSVPAGENYVLLILEREVCAGNWAPITSYYRVSANFLPY
jgi:tetratricopeptide (TPR) repeat protein